MPGVAGSAPRLIPHPGRAPGGWVGRESQRSGPGGVPHPGAACSAGGGARALAAERRLAPDVGGRRGADGGAAARAGARGAHVVLVPDGAGAGAAGGGVGLAGVRPVVGSGGAAADGGGWGAVLHRAGGGAAADAKTGPVVVVGHSLGGLVAVELALRGKVPVERLVLIDAMGLGPEMTPLARAFFRAGPERVARALGPSMFERLLPSPETPLGRRLGALGYELLAVPEGRSRAARAFNTLVPLMGGVFHRLRATRFDTPARAPRLGGEGGHAARVTGGRGRECGCPRCACCAWWPGTALTWSGPRWCSRAQGVPGRCA